MVDDAAGGRKCFSGAAIPPPMATTILLPAAQPNIWTPLHIRPRPLCWLFIYAVSRARRRDRRVVVVLGVADLASDLRSDAGETYVAGRATPRRWCGCWSVSERRPMPPGGSKDRKSVV